MISEIDIIQKCKFLKMTNTTIAQILGVNEKTIRNRIKSLKTNESESPNISD